MAGKTSLARLIAKKYNAEVKIVFITISSSYSYVLHHEKHHIKARGATT
jgi:replication-associated recombination protein RarA